MKPLVSVVMPAYNAEPFVADAIRSAAGQSWPQVEVIVVNDGSRDGTLAAARGVADPRVKIIDQPNAGAAAARNRGLAEAQGEFIQYLDADDLLAGDKVAEQMRTLADRPDCVSTCRWGRFTTDPNAAGFCPEPFWQNMNPLDWVVSRWERASMMHPAGWLVPRQVIATAGNWDETLSLNDDGEYFDRTALACSRVLFCPEAITYYRSGLPGSLSGSKSPAAWRSLFKSNTLGANRILASENSLRTRRACSRGYEEFVYASYPDAPDLRREATTRIRELGGPYFQPQMGPRMARVARMIGWRLAKRLQRLAR